MEVSFDRVEEVLRVIVAATRGEFDSRVKLEEIDDGFLEVEVGINFLLEELTHQSELNTGHRRALREQTEQIATQAEALVRALSTPVLQLWPGVLALPIVGELDLKRAANITEVVLARLKSESATHIILDLTGVKSLVAETIASLLRMMRAIELLGVKCFVTGIQPAVASQWVELGLDGQNVRMFARVSQALALVLLERDIEIGG